MAAIAWRPLDLRGGFELGEMTRVDVDTVRGNARELRSTHRLPVELLRRRHGCRVREDLRAVRGVEAVSGDMKPDGYCSSDRDEQDTSHTAESPSRRTVMLQWSFRGNERVGIPRLAVEDIHDALRGRRSRLRLDMRLVVRRDREGVRYGFASHVGLYTQLQGFDSQAAAGECTARPFPCWRKPSCWRSGRNM